MSNVQVAVRCRGRNARETTANSKVVVELPSPYCTTEDAFVFVSNQHGMNPTSDSKTYKVDQAYGSQADQRAVYEKLAKPLLHDFMDGSNVSILSYGQTGTGKTYTMCGEINKGEEHLTDRSGIIPRVLHDIFTILSENDDYVVKTSHIELYNEEPRDLLADIDKPLRLYESNGKTTIQNIKYDHISDFVSGFALLKRGLEKRRTASTKINDVSSRSHAIFTILLYKKSSDQNFLVSKMHLVDLAGSENIGKSGATNQRAKEAGSINQSLHALNRVIISLTTSTPHNHIPYRDSKLTRILQDSLGGSTKTAIITTISPAKICLEETLSALEYTSKAKNIKNIPQTGKGGDLVSKKVLLKSLSAELETKNLELAAARTKNGIYLPEEIYKNLISNQESLRDELTETKLENELLRLKGKDFTAMKNEFSNTIAKQQKDSANKIQRLEEKISALSVDLHSRERLLEDKNEEISKLNTKCLDYATQMSQLSRIFTNHVDQSSNTVGSIINKYLRQKDETCELVDDFESALLTSVKEFKLTLSNNVQNFESRWHEYSSTELEKAFSNYSQAFKKVGDVIEEVLYSLKERLSNSELMKYKFIADKEIIEEHMIREKAKRDEVSNKFSQIMMSTITDWRLELENKHEHAILTLSEAISSKENNNLAKAKDAATKEMSDLIKRAEIADEIQKPINIQGPPQLKRLDLRSILPSEPLQLKELDQIKFKIDDDSICQSLESLKKELNMVKEQHTVNQPPITESDFTHPISKSKASSPIRRKCAVIDGFNENAFQLIPDTLMKKSPSKIPTKSRPMKQDECDRKRQRVLVPRNHT